MAEPAHPPPPGFDGSLVASALDEALAAGRRTPVLGIAGLQGSGKSTLASQVAALGRLRGLNVAVVSLDDFYLGRERRRQLAREVHPLLATRGPPGSHDLPLALATMACLSDGGGVALPRFDKLGDDLAPRAQWPMIEGRCDLVILEGWFLHTPPQDAAALQDPLNELERQEDADGRWRQYCNEALARDYPPLWQSVDVLWFLQGPGFDVVPEWRWQQEQTLQAAEPSRHAMSRLEIERFVQFFERVSRQALRTLPALATRTVLLDRQRKYAAGFTGPGR